MCETFSIERVVAKMRDLAIFESAGHGVVYPVIHAKERLPLPATNRFHAGAVVNAAARRTVEKFVAVIKTWDSALRVRALVRNRNKNRFLSIAFDDEPFAAHGNRDRALFGDRLFANTGFAKLAPRGEVQLFFAQLERS